MKDRESTRYASPVKFKDGRWRRVFLPTTEDEAIDMLVRYTGFHAPEYETVAILAEREGVKRLLKRVDGDTYLGATIEFQGDKAQSSGRGEMHTLNASITFAYVRGPYGMTTVPFTQEMWQDITRHKLTNAQLMEKWAA